MPTYKAPLRDMMFVLDEVIGTSRVQSIPQFSEVNRDLIEAVFNESARFTETVLHPLNQSGDKEGCHWHDHAVTTPKGFKEAYKAFVDGGWPTLTGNAEYGGQGLPNVISMMTEEMICSSNLAFSLYPGLTRGSSIMLERHGSKELKDKYLPKLIQGTWAGTMCLTEPHCGTDLGLLRTKAELQSDGTYRISGTKIFISSGDHDLTDNIIHFVIARTPEAAPGIKGISLFLVPKFMVNEDDSLGERNPVFCASIEHKMGIKASSTCVMNFDGAVGYLVGDLYKGINNMFTMMNTERIGVGMQGLGIAEVAYQNALAYARDRLQGRSLTGPKYPDKPADPLMVHPDIRRMLLTMKSMNEGCRLLAAWVAETLDVMEHSSDPVQKQEAEDFVQLMTPIIKAFLTDVGTEGANLGLQVFGGHGYIHEWGMEQFARDARIAQIYEGTNGVQALDLIGRKLPAHAGRFLRRFFHPLDAYLTQHATNIDLADFIQPLAKVYGRLQHATVTIATKALGNADEAGAAATDYLRLFGLTALAYLWCRAVEVAQAKIGQGEDDFYEAKIHTARFFMTKVLPQSSALFSQIMAGAKPLMNFDDKHFG
ncbi:acyl-CoA dehydrogenase C-terminal domain-containing protein [Candidatus Odyssella acanthamoebae]|uniref:3-methylmercaptopropionyl-CoA dehydrogenase n=1 Tax=Candidatus Odyssella acanthamoebae TaxID=91604 RepID=A0A077AT66_9PROT|nr:acyl-CoA dehydrogenase C-terminal domain-containing protein [Candidatus Paracaedibacter acanthamoebae]AIK95566.1 acyl-CoA dehydrogenase [Candidatus Paracaedibacter acanthamoebae]